MTCPCCRKDINPNLGGVNLAIHRDKAGKPCEGSGFPINRIEEL